MPKTTSNRARQLRVWLTMLARFEVRLRVTQARARNAYVRSAAKSYETHGTVPTRVTDTHRRRTAQGLAAHYRRVVPAFADAAIRQIKSRSRIERKAVSDVSAAQAAEWIAREALRKAKLIADTDRDDVLEVIGKGMTEGLGAEQIARNIRKVSQLTPFRAATVARTETHAAASYGSIESIRSAERGLGVRMRKVWLPTLDDRTREDHRAMENHPPIPLDEKFNVGGEYMDRPGDPSASPENQINCRCALAYEEQG